MVENNTAVLLYKALHKEFSLYQQMLDLSKEQVELIEAENPDIERIAVLIDQKVQLKNDIEALEDEHRTIKLNWEQSYQLYPDEERQTVKQIRDQITDILELLQALEQKLTEFLQTTEKEVSKELQNIYKSRSINRAYFNLEKHPPKYINRFSK